MQRTQALLGAPRSLLRSGHAVHRRVDQCEFHHQLQTRGLRRPTPLPTTLRPLRRQESTAANAAAATATVASAGWGIANWIYAAATVLVTGFGIVYITDTRASVHQWLVVPTLRLLHPDPEEAHHAGIRYVKGLYAFGLNPRERGNDDQKFGDLKVEVFGHVLDNPLGTSAGIDKDAEVPSALLALGPAIVEVGGVTPLPQEGNPKPRVFRIPSQNALINRYGLNSQGAEHVAKQLRERIRKFAYDNGLGLEPESQRIVLDGEAEVPPGSLVPGKLLAVQIAKNKTTPDSDIAAVARDYVTCVEHLGMYADILVVNVSSPNTPGLRDLQATAPLTAILTAVVKAAKATDRKTKPAVMVKVSPDEDSESQINGICSAVWNSGVNGVIVGNTTRKRPDPIPKGYVMPAKEERLLEQTGGYSGPQMFERTLALVGRYRSKLDHWSPPEDTSVPAPATRKQDPPSTSDSNPADISVNRDVEHLKPLTTEAQTSSENQPLIQIPERHSSPSYPSSESTLSPSSKQSQEPKVIFATGGITTGDQCLQILNAGASVCQVYTAMMYGGVGTITRMKREMRETIKEESGKKA